MAGIHITYKRQRVKHVVVDSVKLTSAPMSDGTWPRAGQE